ncbi:MAG: hypothetical protein LBH92_03830 [Bacteroidales bacterium]|jgi:hypothetical protein|nr:hypothetical protein [Bacteroidales bacterium]
MKKLLTLFIMTAMIVGVAQAQYKPEGGDVTVELQFTPFGDKAFSEMGLQSRIFFNKKIALRVGLDYGMEGGKLTVPYLSGDKTYDEIYKTSSVDFHFAPGVEFHFGNWERVSVYAGTGFLVGLHTCKSSMENTENNVKWESKGGIMVYDYYGAVYLEDMNAIKFGVHASLGTDVYLVKGLYMGAELKLGHVFEMSPTGNAEITYTDPSGTMTTVKLEDKATGYDFGFSCTPQIRLGWRF